MYITGDASPHRALSYTEKAAVMALDWCFVIQNTCFSIKLSCK